ncbi:MAG TPA: ABC transporter ATP-binding protein [Spirochaetota bacterium]|nr:ABC transporter ATP-binding protein [Spirochaetota bacterium]HQO39003.1 ABC transporter ATP-binding protein [Spirochaetota bacterium]
MNAVECRDVVKSFGEPPLVVLKSLNFSIEKGEFTGITGRSGSGKSTLLYVMSGLDDLSSGSILLAGRDITEFSDREMHVFRNRNMGFVFQFHYLLPELTALENILMPARKFKLEQKKRDYALSLMESFEVIHCRDKIPSKMSGGEMQRTAVARALVMQPDILFADEPTGNLDSENGEKVMNIFRRINSELGTTIIMVTHEPDYAAMASRQLHLVDGTIDYDSAAGRKRRKK